MERKISFPRFAPVLLCLLLSVLLLGCGGGGGKKVLYVVGTSSTVAQTFTVAGSGALTVTSTPGTTGANPSAIVLDPQHKYAYVADAAFGASAGGVTEYNVDNAGKLTILTNTTGSGSGGALLPPIPTGAQPIALVMDSGGHFVFVANQGSNNVSVFEVDRPTGVLTEVSGSPFAAGGSPSGIAVTGSDVFVANAADGTISAYTFDSTGALKPVSGSPFAAGTSPTGLAISSSGKYLYAADSGGNAVLGYSIGSDGALSAISGSPFLAGTAPVSVATDADKYVFSANSGSNDVSMFSIGASGALTAAGGAVATGSGPSFVTTDSTGALLFVANGGSDDISVFSIKSGSLAAVSGSPFNSLVLDPRWIASMR